MANKKKLKNNNNSKAKNDAASSAATKQPAAGPQPAPAPTQQQQPKGILTPGQLAALILLALGVSRWMQVGSAMRRAGGVVIRTSSTEDGQADEETTTTTNKAAKICLDYFIHSAETVCVDDLVHVWLNFKYMTGLQVILTTLAMWIRGGCWFNENLLKGFNAMLIVTPIVTTVYAFLVPAQDVLVQARIWQQVVMCVVLSFVATPARSQLPFVNRTLGQATTATRRSSYKTVNSLILMSMVMVQMFQVLAGLGLVGSSSDTSSPSSWIPQLPSAITGSSSDEEEQAIASAVKVIHAFWLVDMFTLAAIYFFAWFHLSSDNQKSFLVAAAMVRLTANLVHWPSLIDMQNSLLGGDTSPIIPVETYQAMDWTITTMGVLGYFAPSTLTWKTKL